MKRKEKSNFFRIFYLILPRKNNFFSKEIFKYEDIQLIIKNKTKFCSYFSIRGDKKWQQKRKKQKEDSSDKLT
jgi:lysylphosphatidylglycerol synthetase-like protein (DUF2156 family)